MSNIKEEIVGLVRSYTKKNKKLPNVLELSLLRSLDFLTLSVADVGEDLLDALITEGPQVALQDFGFMGMTVRFASDPLSPRIRVKTVTPRSQKK